LLDENQLLGAARQRLEAKRAGAGKEIEAARARDIVLQPIEQGLANAIGSGPQARHIRKGDASAAPTTADDAHRIAAARGMRFRLGSSHSRYHTFP